MLEILRLTAENVPRTRPTNRRQNISTNPITAATAEANGIMASGPMYIVNLSVMCLCQNLYGTGQVGLEIDRDAALRPGLKPTHPVIRIHFFIRHHRLDDVRFDVVEAARDYSFQQKSSSRIGTITQTQGLNNNMRAIRRCRGNGPAAHI